MGSGGNRIALALLLFLTIGTQNLLAQDAQYSQFYASPLTQNPAFAGSAFQPRAFAQYRAQWTGLPDPFIAYNFAGDVYLRQASSGAGVVIQNQRALGGTYQQLEFRGQYAYQVPLSHNLQLNAGLEAGFMQRSLGFTRLTFGDQRDSTGSIRPFSGDPLSTQNLTYTVPDLGGGFLLFSPASYLALSIRHANQPGLIAEATQSRLPAWFSATAGHVISFGQTRGLTGTPQRPQLTFAAIFKRQAAFQQLDLGTYYNFQPFVIGIWYRGIPGLSGIPGIFNQEALIFLLGLKQDNLSIGYSYDVHLGRIVGPARGSHELSLSYAFKQPGPKRKRQRALPCPRF
jgi:type IX secretion system PorP/SprF family membrane protein